MSDAFIQDEPQWDDAEPIDSFYGDNFDDDEIDPDDFDDDFDEDFEVLLDDEFEVFSETNEDESDCGEIMIAEEEFDDTDDFDQFDNVEIDEEKEE